MDQTPRNDETNFSPLALIIYACCFWAMTRLFLSVQQRILAGYHQKLRYWIKTSLGTTSFQDLITLMPPSCFWIVGHIIGRMYCTFLILYTTRPLEQFSFNFLLYFVAGTCVTMIVLGFSAAMFPHGPWECLLLQNQYEGWDFKRRFSEQLAEQFGILCVGVRYLLCLVWLSNLWFSFGVKEGRNCSLKAVMKNQTVISSSSSMICEICS
jgi:hypothetical protein